MRCLVLASWLGVGLAAVSSSGPVGDERGTSDGALKEKVARAMKRPDGLFSARWRLRMDCESSQHQVYCRDRKVYTFTLEDPSELPRLAEILRDQGELVLDHYQDVRANVKAVENFLEKQVSRAGSINLVGLDGGPLGIAGTPIRSTETWEDVESRVAKQLGARLGTLSLVPTNSGGGLHEGQPLRGPVKHSGVEHTKQVTIVRLRRAHQSQQLDLEQAAHRQQGPEAAEKLLGTMLGDELGWKRVHVTLGQYGNQHMADKKNRWFLDVEEHRPLCTQCRHFLGSITGCDQSPCGVVSLRLGKNPNGRDDIPTDYLQTDNWLARFAPTFVSFN